MPLAPGGVPNCGTDAETKRKAAKKMTLVVLWDTHQPIVSDKNKYCLRFVKAEFYLFGSRGWQWVIKPVQS